MTGLRDRQAAGEGEARKEGETADWVGSKDGLLFCPESGWLAGGLVE
jgi:hypothetical protein